MNAPPQRDLTLLVAANRAATFGVVARWVLHDIRSPAQSLTLLPDLMRDPGADIETVIRETSEHLGRSLELLSRVIASPPAEGVAPIVVSDTLQFIGALHHSNLTTTRLELDIDPAVQAAAGNQQHLEHAMLCLLLRAVHALRGRRDGHIRIAVRNDGDRIAIEMADNGPELAPEAGAVFDPAYVPAPDRDDTDLLVVQEVLRRSGGNIVYKSDRDRGHRFVITLPAWRRSPSADG
jgi:two-component system C4-dicarboxylate transport sensor histidine kinase DctB